MQIMFVVRVRKSRAEILCKAVSDLGVNISIKIKEIDDPTLCDLEISLSADQITSPGYEVKLMQLIMLLGNFKVVAELPFEEWRAFTDWRRYNVSFVSRVSHSVHSELPLIYTVSFSVLAGLVRAPENFSTLNNVLKLMGKVQGVYKGVLRCNFCDTLAGPRSTQCLVCTKDKFHKAFVAAI